MSKFVLTAQLQLKAPNNVGSVVNNIQKQLKGVNVNVGVQGAAAANKQVNNLANNLNKADKAGQSMGKNFALSIKRFSALAIATRTVSLFTNTLSKAIDESIQFERELIKISQVTGKTTSQLRFLTDSVTSLARGLGVSSSALLNTSRMLSQAGFSAKETQIALKTLARTELAPTFDNITATTEGAIAIFNQFRLGAAALEAQLGAVNAVAGQFAVEAGDLIAVIRRTGGVFKAAGGDLNELIALFTSVRSTTRESAESISTGLRTIFTRIQRPKTIEFLKQYGIELTDLNGKFVGPFEATRKLSAALAGLEQGDLSFIEIAEELGGFRQIGKVIPLIQQFRVAQDALNVAQGGSGSLASDAAKAQLALGVRIAKVKEEFLSLVRAVTETQTFQVMADTALRLASALIRIGDAIKPLLPLLATFAAIKIGKGILGFVGGMSGGGVRGFNRGGPVPGVGSTDTVPAMLTPGEFVIRKKSAQSIGMNNLQDMNRYATGGIVDMSSSKVQGRIYRGKRKVTKAPGAAFTDSHQFTENDKVQGAQDAVQQNLRNLKNLDVTFKDQSSKKGTILDALASDNVVQQGRGYEDGLRLRKYLGSGATGGSDASGIDPVDGAESDGSKVYEVKRTEKSSNVMLDKALRYVIDTGRMKNKQMRGVDEVDTFKVPPLTQYTMPPDLPARAKEVKDQLTAQAAATGGKKKNAKVARENSGGPISGKDTVPALLTPGEFVINKKSAQAIGRSTLNRMNTQGYNKGGSVHPKGPKRMFFGGMMGMGGGGGASLDTSAVQAALDTLGASTNNTLQALQSFSMGLNNSSQMLNQQVQAQANQLRMSGQLSSAAHRQISTTVKKNAADLKNQASMMKLNASVNQLNNSAKQASNSLTSVAEPQASFGSKLTKMAGGLAIGASMLQSFLPPLDESSGMFTKLAHSGLAFITTIGMTITSLGMFAASLEGTAIMNTLNSIFKGIPVGRFIKDLFTKGAAKTTTVAFNRIASTVRSAAKPIRTLGVGVRKVLPNLGKPITRLGRTIGQVGGSSILKLGKFAAKAGTGLGLAALAIDGFAYSINAIGGFDKKLKEAIEGGDVEGAKSAAQSLAATDALSSIGGSAALGASIGSLAGPIGTAVGAFAGLAIGLATYDYNQVQSAIAAASTAKANIELEKASKSAASAMKEFEAGNISAKDALLQSSAGSKEAADAIEENKKANKNAEASKSGLGGGFLRGAARVGTLGIAGLMGLESGAQRNARIDSEIQDREGSNKDMTAKMVENAQPALNAFSRRVAATGGTFNDFQMGLKETNPSLYAHYLKNGFQDLNTAFENQAKEIQRNKDAFEAMNLGLNSIVGAAQGAAVGIDNYLAAQEMGAVKTERTLATLEAGISAAAIGLDPAQFGSALDDAEKTLRSFGANDDQISKMRKNLTAVNEVQKNMPEILKGSRETLMADLERGAGGGSLEERRSAVAGAIESQLKAAGIGDQETLDQFRDQLMGKNLSEKQLDAIASGDMKVLEEIIGDIGGDTMKQLQAALGAAAEAEKALIGVIKKRQEAETNLVNAQRKALDVQMEVMELQEEFGGKVVSSGERISNIVASANVGTQGLGISQMRGGSAADASQRNNEIRQQLSAIQNTRMAAAGGNQNAQAAMSGASGTEMADREKRLLELNKNQADVTRKLIDEKRKEIEAIKARNQAEKDAMKSLLAGDIDKFFEQQAAIGATAAAASGNQAAMGQFSAQDFGRGFENLEKMQQGGAKSFLGAQIGGAGGLLESTASAGLSMAGITDPSASQAMAGTDPATLALQEEARALAATLNENAQTDVDVAQKQLDAANLMMTAAQQQVTAAQQRANNAMAQGRATGGLIYASTGKHIKFTPRGTDTVPAMLTPGEFVVRKSAVDRGNNLSALKAINSGSSVSAASTMSKGGQVAYMNEGGKVGSGAAVGGIDASTLNNFSNSLSKFNNELSKNISNLQNLELKVTLNPTAINVNLQGGSFLENLAQNIKQDLISFVGDEISNYSVGNDGKLRKSGSTLGSTV
jgi:hypothetical protein